MKIITIIGARPQIIKAASISRAIKDKFSDKIQEVIVHTGQHYDKNMSAVFFDEIGVPRPLYNLKAGSSTHAEQTAIMLKGIEEVLLKENADALLVYGDTNSTVAGALVASKNKIPVIHIEAGLRSFNKEMPEEINRIVTDHLSTLLYSPTLTGQLNLGKEGIISSSKKADINNPKVFVFGDIMYDNSLYFSEKSNSKEAKMRGIIGNDEPFMLATVHRDSNTDNHENLLAILKAFIQLCNSDHPQIVLPLHPRTFKAIEKLSDEFRKQIAQTERLKIIEPVSFLEVTWLESKAELILTDSGGVQKEAFFFKKPCVILREQTEWVEIVESGCGILAHTDTDKIIESVDFFLNNKPLKYPSFYGEGNASEKICENIIKELM